MSKTNKELLEFGSKKITHNYAEAQFSFLEEFNKEPKFRLTLIGLNKETSERVWDFILKEINQEPILLSRGGVMDVEATINSFEKIYKFELDEKIVKIDGKDIEIFSHTPFSSKFEDGLNHIINEKRENDQNNSVFILSSSQERGLYLENFKIDNQYKSLNLEENYNDDFIKFDNDFKESLKNNHVGLYLLHGIPGTGKTTYLRSIIRQTSKRVIFVPPLLANNLSDPNMIPFLMTYPDSILIIEDAENIVQKRTQGENQSVSNLLNITDGILGDCLKFQIICTFNTQKDQVDPALTRKGRMLLSYEFDKLDVKKSNSLLKKLDHKETTTPLTIGEIYNRGKNNGELSNGDNRKIGF